MMKLFNDWILQPQYLTAWLQAFAALVALFISGLAVWRTEGVARRRNRLELRGVAVAIYPEIEMLIISTQNVRDGMTLAKKRDGHLVDRI
jgi:hypothetical protein